MDKKIIILFVVIIAVVSSTGVLYPLQSENKEVETGTSVGKRAPSFTLTDLDGNELRLKDMRGKVVILDFMATWCGGCIAEMPHLNQIDSEYDDSILKLITIDIDPRDNLEQLENFKNEYGADWRFAKGVEVGNTYKIRGIPTILIIDGDGIIRHRSGPISAEDLKPKLENVI